MNIWSTFRFVPPIAPEALAWATLSFATYLMATEARPSLFGTELSPLALALAVQMTLSITKNACNESFAHRANLYPKTAALWLVLTFSGFATMALWASDAMAAKLFIVYVMMHALLLIWAAHTGPPVLRQFVGTWTRLKTNAKDAVSLEAAGLGITALTLTSVWVFAGPLGFAAMMSFGVLVTRTLANWVIVLFLLDAEKRRLDE